MQSEIINEILSVEDDADKIVDDAQKKASGIVSDAEAKAAALVKDALKKEREKNQAALKILMNDNAEKLAAYQKELEKQIVDEPDLINKLSGELADKICNSSVY
ncbi:MAG: hypothetical protein LKE40_05000 [Spirochaetia bacterium]|jgi:vacuolar-type H+-ATPase subunit H|nr:hypothetical protein [Spirochaetia bacterium]